MRDLPKPSIERWQLPERVNVELLQSAIKALQGGGISWADLFIALEILPWAEKVQNDTVKLWHTRHNAPKVAAEILKGIGFYDPRVLSTFRSEQDILEALKENQYSVWYTAFGMCLKNYRGLYNHKLGRIFYFHEYLREILPIRFGRQLRRYIPRKEVSLILVQNEPEVREGYTYEELAQLYGITIAGAKYLFGPSSKIRSILDSQGVCYIRAQECCKD